MRPTIAVLVVSLASLGWMLPQSGQDEQVDRAKPAPQVHYLEIVTPDVDAVCAVYAAANGLKFGDPVAGFGNARMASLPGGGMVGVRAPLRESEEPVVRPYWLVDDIEAAFAAAEEAGCQVAIPPMEMAGGHGRYAIYLKGGIDHGLWER
jgi:predicted enzyme related to lactoylglutathione lyase